jgi:hypothetical protein
MKNRLAKGTRGKGQYGPYHVLGNVCSTRELWSPVRGCRKPYPSHMAFIDRILGISRPAAASLSASVANKAPTQPITDEYYA